jgi:hypothetical protein
LNFALLVEKQCILGDQPGNLMLQLGMIIATQLRYNIDERVAELSHYSKKVQC